MSLWVVVGGQFGSEGKGKVSAFIAKQENIDICIRCGGPNSGHSFVNEEGKTIILRQLPTGFVNEGARLLIPAGALVDPVVLRNEIESLGLSPRRIGIDPNCFIIEERDKEAEKQLGLRERISSTLCGVGAALSRRVLRGENAKVVRDVAQRHPWLREMIVENGVSAEVNTALDQGKSALIEGTQGFGLSLYHSGYYPQCTSRDTTAAAFLSEVGLSPRLVTEIVVVFRTFPIRVAGEQAGPLRNEVTWERVREESGYPYDITERTSVTMKPRRIGRFDWGVAEKSIRLNRPTRIAINGLDYLDYADKGKSDFALLTLGTQSFVGSVEKRFGVPVMYYGVGPALQDMIETQFATQNIR